jgi:hypothetical protein
MRYLITFEAMSDLMKECGVMTKEPLPTRRGFIEEFPKKAISLYAFIVLIGAS